MHFCTYPVRARAAPNRRSSTSAGAGRARRAPWHGDPPGRRAGGTRDVHLAGRAGLPGRVARRDAPRARARENPGRPEPPVHLGLGRGRARNLRARGVRYPGRDRSAGRSRAGALSAEAGQRDGEDRERGKSVADIKAARPAWPCGTPWPRIRTTTLRCASSCAPLGTRSAHWPIDARSVRARTDPIRVNVDDPCVEAANAPKAN